MVRTPLASTVALRLLACSAVLSWLRVLTLPPVPVPKVTLTAVPPLKEEKLRVLPLMPPTPAVRAAVKAVAGAGVAGEPERGQGVAGAGDGEIGVGAGADLQRAGGVDRGGGLAGRGGDGRRAAGIAGGLDAGRQIDRLEHVGDGAALQIDGGVAAAVGDDVADFTGTGGDVRGRGLRRVRESDDMAVDIQRRAGLDQRAEAAGAGGAERLHRGIARTGGGGQAERLQVVGLAGDREVLAGRALQQIVTAAVDGGWRSGRRGHGGSAAR